MSSGVVSMWCNFGQNQESIGGKIHCYSVFTFQTLQLLESLLQRGGKSSHQTADFGLLFHQYLFYKWRGIMPVSNSSGETCNGFVS
ncbi:hypothetical protein ACROYT_G016900 [Oculina patagonica]